MLNWSTPAEAATSCTGRAPDCPRLSRAGRARARSRADRGRGREARARAAIDRRDIAFRSFSVRLDERDAVDLFERRLARERALERGLAQNTMPDFFAASLMSLRAAALDEHLAELVGEIQELADGVAAFVARARALDAAFAAEERVAAEALGVEPRVFEELDVGFERLLAERANRPHQPLGEDAVERRDEVVRLRRPCSEKRPMTSMTLLACTVVNTRWPVSAALIAICAVSASRISPTMTLSGS